MTILSIILIVTATFWLLKEAIDRVKEPEKVEVHGKPMLITAIAGLFFNLIQMK